MEKLETVRKFLLGCDALAGIDFQVDYLSKGPDMGGIFPEGVQVVARKQDILGNQRLRLREQYRIRLRLPHIAEADNPENAARLQRLQSWAVTAPMPPFGAEQTVTVEKGRLVSAMGQGLGAYEAVLTVAYTVETEG